MGITVPEYKTAENKMQSNTINRCNSVLDMQRMMYSVYIVIIWKRTDRHSIKTGKCATLKKRQTVKVDYNDISNNEEHGQKQQLQTALIILRIKHLRTMKQYFAVIALAFALLKNNITHDSDEYDAQELRISQVKTKRALV